MRNVIGGLIATGLILSGSYHRAKKEAMSDHKILPLFFHTISKEFFKKCIRWLKENGFVFISTKQLISYLNGAESIPERAVWITFDDGWKENISNVIPTIIEYDIPVTFFISTDPIEHGGVFWWSYVTKYGKYLPEDCNTIKKMRRIKENRRKELIEGLEKKFSKSMTREAMTVQDVINISKLPQITIGCHTVNHVIMPNCTDAELEYELKRSKELIEHWINNSITLFSYPEGIYDQRSKEFVVKHGFEFATSIDNRFITKTEDLYAIPRFWVRGEGFFSEAKCQMLGIWNPFIWKISKMMKINSYNL